MVDKEITRPLKVTVKNAKGKMDPEATGRMRAKNFIDATYEAYPAIGKADPRFKSVRQKLADRPDADTSRRRHAYPDGE